MCILRLLTLVVGASLWSQADAFAPRMGCSKVSISSVSSFQKNHKFALQMSVEGDFDPDAISRAKEEVDSGSVRAKFRALYKFARPHTIRGTILASIAGTTRALIDTPGAIANAKWRTMLPRAFIGMVALVLGNAFIVGINQIFDKDIDEMNKPFLPVASGEMSKKAAWIAVVASGAFGPILVGKFFPQLLFRLYCFGLLLGGIYSVPPIRTKKNPLLAGLTIATVRGFLLNFGVYYAVKDAIGATFQWSPKVSFVARFMTIFATVIAVTKDLPDIEGDKAFQIETFATKVGVKRIAQGASLCLLGNYIHAVLTGVVSNTGVYNIIPMVGALFLLSVVSAAYGAQALPWSLDTVTDKISIIVIILWAMSLWTMMKLNFKACTLSNLDHEVDV
eukprot:scaffold8995_cov139-Cylindrotheca_fusiformis.AAC.2